MSEEAKSSKFKVEGPPVTSNHKARSKLIVFF